MIRVQSRFGKTVAITSVASLVIAMVPSLVFADAYKQVKASIPKAPPVPAPSKVLSAKTMKVMQGRAGENPYAAGQSKSDVVYKGVNLMNGNYSTSGTDLTFEGGYGIPVNVTRSYSANNGEEGPLGKGWTLSVDVRSTAGGLMKSGSAPVRAVPVNFKERPSAQIDPNAVTADGASVQPVAAVLATDSGGTEETIQRDVDGILSTPPWDKNKIDSEYETIIKPDGSNVRIMTKNWVHTPEGTVYVYEKKGTYVGGTRPFNNPTATPEDSNVLKIMSATDRHGNVTNYTYGTNFVTFVKQNGTVSENPLIKIQMPNQHIIEFEWTGNRMTKAKEVTPGGNVLRQVTYTYSSGLLTGVTTPGGKTTSYGYGNAAASQTPMASDPTTGIIVSITDPRGITETIEYEQGFLTTIGYVSPVKKLTHGNGSYTLFNYGTGSAGYGGLGTSFPAGSTPWSTDIADSCGVLLSESAGNRIVDLYRPTDGFVAPGLYYRYSSTTFNEATMDEIEASSFSGRQEAANFPTHTPKFVTTVQSKFNFVGNPLTMTVKTYDTLTATYVDESTVAYSYWGADKYYQQKAVKDPSGRYSFTDYYDTNAAQGSKGQTYRVYDQKRATIDLDTSITPPNYGGTPNPDAAWRYQIRVATPNNYSAQFEYDYKGRPSKVWKIQKTTTTPWTYVQTYTEYGIDGAPSWGAASKVVEDYGGINRTTETLAYDAYGRAIRVKDASGKEFLTNYDLDGVIQSIQRVDGAQTTNLVSYTYGTTGVTNGAVLSVTDNLSGISQAMTYFTSGSSVGQVQSVTETNGSDTYSSAYTYNAFGDRDTATYTTQAALGQSNTVKWKYWDYVPLGTPGQASRAFQRLTRVDNATGNMTPEEFHYKYDVNGRVLDASYAMTPQTWTPSAGASYYDSAHPVQTRGRAHYDYDFGGRLKGIYNWWDTRQSNGNYASQFVRGNECDYELTGLKRGLKTASRYLTPVSGSPLAWQTQRQETYSYDANLDYLVGANYGDGLPNANVSWGYDAAGNRVSDSAQPGTWSYDNLNRMTASPNTTYTNDILGNRITKTASNVTTMTWDILNRMMSVSQTQNSNGPTNYQYRADGLRVKKSRDVPSTTGTLYRYDGQMGIEDVEYATNPQGTTVTALTRYGLGARGIDVVSRTTSSGNTVSYPVYDAHGNNVGALSKSGSSFVVSDEKSYDAWGGLRSGTNANGKAAYCANLGHKQDDESGLIYMRARFYEPTSGRFVSEDIKRAGFNWFAYCSNNPVDQGDFSGCEEGSISKMILGMYQMMGATYGFAILLSSAATMAWAKTPAELSLAVTQALAAVQAMTLAFAGYTGHGMVPAVIAIASEKWVMPAIRNLVANAAIGTKTSASKAVMACTLYSMVLMSFLISNSIEDMTEGGQDIGKGTYNL